MQRPACLNQQRFGPAIPIPVRLSDAGALAGLAAENMGHLQTFTPMESSLDSLAATEQYLLSAERARICGQDFTARAADGIGQAA